MLNFLDDLFRSGDSDNIAENPWANVGNSTGGFGWGNTGNDIGGFGWDKGGDSTGGFGWGNVKSDF